ncbi:MAG: hypothetical protein SD837_04935 [Candidatus Electrothrix scaldis]|nr:MAG: hypothetical protein SD837_04935 [Candidatus Electrothrix sp. GW3-3]
MMNHSAEGQLHRARTHRGYYEQPIQEQGRRPEQRKGGLMKLELLGQIGQWIADTGQWLWDHPEVTWSGAGLTGLAALYFLITKLFAPLFGKDSAPPVSNTFTHSGTGDQNIAQGDGAIAKQENVRDAQIGVQGDNAKVKGGIHFNNK